MGVVRPLRSESLFHGIAAAMTAQGDPVVLISSTNRPYVAVPFDEVTASAVNRQHCERYKIAIIPRQIGAILEFVDPQHLSYHIIMPRPGYTTEGVSLATPQWRSDMAIPVTAAYQSLGVEATFSEPDELSVAGKKIGNLTVSVLDSAVVLSGALVAKFDRASAAGVLSTCGDLQREKVLQSLTAHTTTFSQELDQPPSAEIMATHLIDALESQWHYEVYPSFPTPGELENIEQYDEILGSLVLPEATGVGATIEVPISTTASVLWSTLQFDGGTVEAVVSIASGNIEGVVLSGDITDLPADVLAELAARFTGHGMDADMLRGQFEALQKAEQFDPSMAAALPLHSDDPVIE